MASLTMSRSEREAFLAETHVGMVAVAESGRGPLTVPVWYRYAPGDEVCFVTGANSRKAKLIRQANRIGFCVQTETAPYKYVSIEGPATLGEVNYERDVRAVAIRYLGEQMGEMYLAMMANDPEPTVLVSLKPARWYSVDYSKLG